MFNKINIRDKETFHNIIWRGIHIFGTKGITFLIFIICAKLLNAFDFGLYNYVLTIAFFLIIFTDFGISKASSKYVAEYNAVNKEKLKSVLFNAALIILMLSCVISLLVLFLGRFIFSNQYLLYIYYLLPLLFFAPLSFLYDGIYRGLKKFKELSIISLIVSSVSLGFVFILVDKYKLTGALIAQNLFYFLLFIALTIRYKNFNFKIDKKIIKEIGKYSLFIGVAGIFAFFTWRVDILFLGHYNFIKEIGFYEIAYKILALFIIPFTIIGQVIAPDITKYFSTKNYFLVNIKFKKYLFFSIIVSTVFLLMFILLKHKIFSLFFNKYYTNDMKHLLIVMLPLYFTSMLLGMVSPFAVSTGHAKMGMHFLIIVGLLNLVFDYIFINLFDFWGLIYSTIIIKCLGTIIFIYFYYKILRKLILNRDSAFLPK
jgi:O-antigen/teichoic acid export membrane protein